MPYYFNQFDGEPLWDFCFRKETIVNVKSSFSTKGNKHEYACVCVCVCIYIYICYVELLIAELKK